MLRFGSDSGLTLSSFLSGLLLSTLLSLSLIRYCHHIIMWVTKQRVELEGQRLAFRQLDVYPDLIVFDDKNWRRKINVAGAGCYCLSVKFEHKSGYRACQTRLQCSL